MKKIFLFVLFVLQTAIFATDLSSLPKPYSALEELLPDDAFSWEGVVV